jgi:RNA polymerase sigma factor (sigma-70 family)
MHAMTLARPGAAAAVEPVTVEQAADAHLDDVYGYLLYLTRHRETAEDLTGATFEKAVRLWGRFDPRRGSAKAWLLGIARSTALDHFRSESRRRRREERAAPPERFDESFADGVSPALQAGLAALSSADREIVALRIVLELEGDATARLLGISPSAVSTRLSRALQRLEEKVSTDDLN